MTDLGAYLTNWARWCLRTRECFPDGYACMSIEGKWWVPYKNGDPSTQEKLEHLLEHAEPDERAALKVERCVVSLAEPMRSALWVQWIELPETERMHWRQTAEQWQERRARFLNHRLRNLLPGRFHIRGAGDFEEAIASAESVLDRCLLLAKAA